MTNGTASFNPRPSSFMGVLAWAATEARLRGFPFCPLAGERVGGYAVEWLSRSFDAMSPTHKFDVEVTDLATGIHTTFSVIRKQRTYRATGRTTVRYNTPVGNFGTFDEVNAALVAEAQRRVAEALAAAGEMQAAPGGDASDSETQGAETHSDTPTQGEGVPVYPALALDNPVTGSVHLPYHVGPFEQPQQRHYAGAVAEVAPADTLPTAEEVIAELVTCVEAQAAVDQALDAGAVQGDIVRQEEIATRSLNWLMDLPGAHLRQLGAQAVRDAALLAAYEEALTPSAGTKYAYSGEFSIQREQLDENGDEVTVSYDVDWTTLKDVLAAVRARVQARVDGPHAQPEQQQAQALAVAVAGFEPECRQCAALLDAKGHCPICPRPTPWKPCETGVRHHQTIPESREVAYTEHRKADRAATQARAEGAESARQRRLDEASQDAWTAYRRWVDADSFAAQAGAHDHLCWADY